MNTDLSAHYQAVLNAELSARDQLCAQIKHLNLELKQKDVVIAALRASLTSADAATRDQAKPLPFAQPIGLASPTSALYAGISVRWALLSMMGDHTSVPLTTSEMAERLIAGGVRSGGERFSANVSAVVSDMKTRQELEVAEDGKYRISARGREVWEGIKQKPQYKRRRLDSSNV